MNYAYIFSLLPHILVLSNNSCDHVSAHLMCSLPLPKLNPHQKLKASPEMTGSPDE